jgi:hypothetical protein
MYKIGLVPQVILRKHFGYQNFMTKLNNTRKIYKNVNLF